MKNKSIVLATLIMATIFILSCAKQDPMCDGSEPTYDNEIGGILTAECATGSCHPSYASYSGLQGIINNGEFESVVLKNQTMPRGGKLSQSQINSIQCWVDNDYPEN
jgi:hypothetical protein